MVDMGPLVRDGVGWVRLDGVGGVLGWGFQLLPTIGDAKEQVRSNKDASKGRDKEAQRESLIDILQIVC